MSLLIRTTTPAKPTSSPSTFGTVILSSCSATCAMTMVNNGTVASRMAATAEFDGLLAPRDQEEGDGNIDDAQQQQGEPFFERPRQLCVLCQDHHDAE